MGEIIDLSKVFGKGKLIGRDGIVEKGPDEEAPRQKLIRRTPTPSPRRKLLKREKPLTERDRLIASGVDSDVVEGYLTELPGPMLQQEAKKFGELDPIEQAVRQLEGYRRKPLLFWQHELGIPTWKWRNDKPPPSWKKGMPVPLWSKQRELIEAVVKYRKVACKSGHATGKTFDVAGIALYLLYVWHCIVLTTAPTFRQVRRALWGEIHFLFNGAPKPLGGKLNQLSLDLDDKWFMEGFATDKPEYNITGIHEENIAVVVDEAGGIEPKVIEALEGVLTSENSFVIFIGNPLENQGPFADAFKPDSGFHKMSISCYEVPNIKHDRLIYSKLVSPQWVKDKEKKWKGTPMFASRVEGEFPLESKDTLIPLRYLDAALERDLPEDVLVSFGLDVARQGSDSTVFGARWKSGKFRVVEQSQKERTTECAGRMKRLYSEMVPAPEKVEEQVKDEMRKEGQPESEIKEAEIDIPVTAINVDDIGYGGGVTDMLMEEDYPVNGINVGESPDHLEPDNKIFLNKRAQYYWNLRNFFMDGRVDIDDEELAFELSKMRVEYLRSGKIKIVDKELIKKELKGRSPDRAEAMMLAFAEDEASVERDLVRFI
jgi:hypothetical protein